MGSKEGEVEWSKESPYVIGGRDDGRLEEFGVIRTRFYTISSLYHGEDCFDFPKKTIILKRSEIHYYHS